MADNTPITLAALIEQQTLLTQQIAEKELPAVIAARTLLSAPAITSMVAQLISGRANVSPAGPAYNQIGYAIDILQGVPAVLAAEEARLTGLVAG